MRPPKKKGDISQAYFIARCLELDWSVSVPVGDCDRYDAIIDKGNGLERVQIKTGRLRSGAVVFPTRSCTYHVPKGCPTKNTSRSYKGEVEWFGVFCPDLKKCFMVPAEKVGPRSVNLRVEDAKNGRKAKIRWAKDFEI